MKLVAQDGMSMTNNTPQNNPPQNTIITQITSPLPPPEMLRHYEHIKPGLIDFIVELTKKEGDHRHMIDLKKLELEKNHFERGDSLIKRAQNFAFILSMSLIIAGSIIAYAKSPVAGGFMSISGIAAMAYLKNSKR